jgi:hypothetical protein
VHRLGAITPDQHLLKRTPRQLGASYAGAFDCSNSCTFYHRFYSDGFGNRLSVKAPIKTVVTIDPWIGTSYVGLNVGYSWGDWDATSNRRVFNFEITTANPKAMNGNFRGLERCGYVRA